MIDRDPRMHLRLTLVLVLGWAFCWLSSGSTVLAQSPTTADAVDATPADSPKVSEADTPSKVVAEVQAGPRALSRAFRFAARRATPAVVTILSYGQPVAPTLGRVPPNGGTQRGGSNESPDSDQDSSPTQDPETDDKQLTGIGSGVIISEDGRVITNNHVIAGAKRVVVQLSDETEFDATEVFGDAASDVATLRIDRDAPLPFADLGDSEQLEIGDWVLAIGSPFRLEATVSAGIISAKNRELGRITRGRMIQTDAAINPGNSGGPLVDLDGQVVAISTAIATRNGGYQGIGFAIPINQAKWIANELAEHGQVRRAAIGLRIAELNPKIAAMFKLPVGLGVLVHQVIEGSAAQRGGIQPIDVIIAIDGEHVGDAASLQSAIERLPVGSFQEFKISRDGKEILLQIEIASMEDPTESKASQDADEADASPADDVESTSTLP
ncbi:Periplasmic serine endoprotease DegP precursor [Rubripirellula lacrimiformis]|uniref:Periplasmic serine endoprotease DegP n=1 Tax=Rubripirellula lacrimiformis TaxID=1930273 RepID=A0A517NHN9_9BACT|nr:trypsin-like peptidase domain-containing protein [Rubripirellula lacrimiformis]QDT06657.1 Periplasmic serine endoprotease DegP precursor [Rubripirellula lacrimiformis]